jgi:hypothetical protein
MESTQGKLNPALRNDVLKRSSIALQLAQSATSGLMATATMVL